MRFFRSICKLAIFFIISFSLISCQDNRFKEVSPKEAKELISKSKVTVLDVRTPEEYLRGHIKGAKNFDFLSKTFFEEIKSLNKTAPYLICSRDGRTGRVVARVLESEGFKNLYNIEGGIIGWTEAGFPVEKGDGGKTE